MAKPIRIFFCIRSQGSDLTHCPPQDGAWQRAEGLAHGHGRTMTAGIDADHCALGQVPDDTVGQTSGATMLTIPPSQLHMMLSQLDQALYNHEQWYRNLSRALIARLPGDPPDLQKDAHHRCSFGQWYYSVDAAPLLSHPAFKAIGLAHEQMHRAATGLLQRQNDSLPISPVELDHFNGHLDRMRLEMQSLRRELSEALQNRDELTGARNRVTLLSDLREQQALVRRGAQACALAMLDLDHFKRVNDEHGHLAGDRVLAATVQCVQSQLRPYDRIYRYGGEEFLLCFPDTGLQPAAGMAQRLRVAIAEMVVRVNGATTPLRITVSIGVTSLEADVPVEECIDRADKALYVAKHNGRNCIEIWSGQATAEATAQAEP